MNFTNFINAFGDGYKRQIDPYSQNHLSKASFCRELLCNITNREELVRYINGITDPKNKRGDAVFQSYYRNSDRRSLHPIADAIINCSSIDTVKFISFLEEYVDNYSKELLLNNFSRYLPDLTSDTLFAEITAALVEILKSESISEPIQAPVSISSQNTTIKTIPSDSEISLFPSEEEKQAIKKICSLLKLSLNKISLDTDSINNNQHELNTAINDNKPSALIDYRKSCLTAQRNQFDLEYTKFENRCAELIRIIRKMIPLHSCFEQIHSIASSVNNDKFRITSDEVFRYNCFSVMVTDFSKYIDRLLSFLKTI